MQTNSMLDDSNEEFGMINEQIAEEYFSHISLFSSKEKSNVERKKGVQYLLKFLAREKILIKDVETKDLDNFLIFLKSGDYRADKKRKIMGPASMRQVIALLRSFYQWCFENHFVEQHPDLLFTKMFKNRLPKVDRKLKTYLTIEEVKTFLDSANKNKKALLYVLYNSMGRINTVLNAKLADFDYENRTLLLYEPKNNVEVESILSDATCVHLQDYILNHRPKFDGTNDPGYIFISKNRSRLTARSVQRYVREHSVKILGKKITPHDFRGLGISHMLDSGAELTAVQNIVGHADPATTARYRRISPKHRKETMKNSHPLNAIETSIIREKRVKETVKKARKDLKKGTGQLLKIVEKYQKQLDEMLE